MTVDRKLLRITAHHEAGHAVAALRLLPKQQIDYVRVGYHLHPKSGEGCDGHVEYLGGVGNKRSFLAIPEAELHPEMVMVLAGGCAELYDQRHRSDKEKQSHAHHDLEIFFGEGPAHSDWAHVEGLMATYVILRDSASWEEGGRRLTTQQQTEVNKRLNEVLDDARAFVVEHWSEIRKLAIELQKRGRMTGDEILELLTRPDQQEAA